MIADNQLFIIMSGQGLEAPSSEQLWEIILQQRKELADFRSYVTDHLKDQQEVFSFSVYNMVLAVWLKARDFNCLRTILG